jgi:hypothetical protein
MIHGTFAFFEHCARERFEHPWRIMSQTCDRCGITYAAHFEPRSGARALTGIAANWSTMTAWTR